MKKNTKKLSNINICCIVITPILLLLVVAFILYKAFNHKYKKETEDFVAKYSNFRYKVPYNKKARKQTIRCYYNLIVIMYQRIEYTKTKKKFWDWNSLHLLKIHLQKICVEFIEYIETILKQDLQEYNINIEYNEYQQYSSNYILKCQSQENELQLIKTNAEYFCKITVMIDIILNTTIDTNIHFGYNQDLKNIKNFNKLMKDQFVFFIDFNHISEICELKLCTYNTKYHGNQILLCGVEVLFFKYIDYIYDFSNLMHQTYYAKYKKTKKCRKK